MRERHSDNVDHEAPSPLSFSFSWPPLLGTQMHVYGDLTRTFSILGFAHVPAYRLCAAC